MENKLIKKLALPLALTIGLIGFRYDELKDLQDYKTTPFIQKDFFIKQTPVTLRFYNPRNDGIDDVVEYYLVKEDKNHHRYLKNPFIYIFDINNNGKIDRGEVLGDESEDGLNGNEVWNDDRK